MLKDGVLDPQGKAIGMRWGRWGSPAWATCAPAR
jgi:phosphoribosylformylglycinamidine (FGAM) synthase PurS component